MTVHIRAYSAAVNGTITDMANAGRRGKVCRTFTFFDSFAVLDYLCTTAEERAARRGSYVLESRSLHEFRGAEFDALVSACKALIAARGVGRWVEGEIRGVDAPKPRLTAGEAGVWAAVADEDGVSVHRLNDPNEWTEITHGQTKGAAYRAAAKVWDRVRAAAACHQAAAVLRAAGVKLHGYCAID